MGSTADHRPFHYNTPFPNVPFFTPQHVQSPATPSDPQDKSVPTLFKPLRIRGQTLKNRVIVAPMCPYSVADSGTSIGALTPWHIATLGHYAIKGAALVFIEATGVQGSRTAGRKASTCPPFVNARFKRPSMRATEDVGGGPGEVVGPSEVEEMVWDGKGVGDEMGGYWSPRESTVEEIRVMVGEWEASARRAVEVGVDVIEVHGAHGYLIHQFLSPVTNRRTDHYGGSFTNRTRLVIEILTAIRSAIAPITPLFLRLSATEWLDEPDIGKQHGCGTVSDTIALSKIVSDLGVDLLDVSSGGNHPSQRINMFESKDYQTRIAAQIRRELRAAGKGMMIGAVGLITEAEQASKIVESVGEQSESGANGMASDNAPGDASIGEEAQVAVQMTDTKAGHEPMADVILVARPFLREPEYVLKVAWKLGVDVVWPMQFNRVRFPKL